MGMVCLLACCCGCSGRPEGAVRLPIVRIDTVGVYGTPRTVQFPGCVRAAQEVNAAFKVGGTLRTIFAEEGEFVRRGAPLAALDARDYRLQAEAAEAEYKRVKAEAERVMALYADGAATPDAYDKARYGLQQITAKYENSRNQLADTEIRMPFDGYVQKRLFDPSTVVGAGMPVLTVVSAEASRRPSTSGPASGFRCGCGASARRPTPTSSIRCGWAFRPICGRSRRRV